MKNIKSFFKFLTETLSQIKKFFIALCFYILNITLSKQLNKENTFNLKKILKTIVLKKLLYIKAYGLAIFSTIVGLNVVLYIFYNRLFIIRKPKIIDEVTFIFILIGICIIILHIYLLRKHIKSFIQLYKQIEPIEKETAIKKIINFFMFIIKEIYDNFAYVYLEFIDWVIKSKDRKFFDFYMNTTIFFSTKLFNYTKAIYYIIFIFPRLLVTIVFFIEVIFFHQITYFYKILWILLIPIIGKILRFTFKEITIISHNGFFNHYHILVEEKTPENTPFEDINVAAFILRNTKLRRKYGLKTIKKHLSDFKKTRQEYYYWDYFYRLDNTIMSKILTSIISCLMIIAWLYIIINYFLLCPANLVFLLYLFPVLLLLVTIIISFIYYLIEIPSDFSLMIDKFVEYLKK